MTNSRLQAREGKAKAERESNDAVSSQKLIGRLENRVQKATNDYDDQLVRGVSGAANTMLAVVRWL